MRVTFTLSPPASAAVDAIALSSGGALWTRRLDWLCDGVPLRLRVIGLERVDLPDPEPSEPVPGAIARVVAGLRGSGALLALLDPARALGAGRVLFAEGVRLFAVADAADEACWDEALSAGQPIYGVRGSIACELARPSPAAALAALAYGAFTCEEGLSPTLLDEDRTGVRWRFAAPVDATVIVRGGYEAARIPGASGEWRDRGGEGYVRVVFTGEGGRCWSQPRFVA